MSSMSMYITKKQNKKKKIEKKTIKFQYRKSEKYIINYIHSTQTFKNK